MMMKSFISFVLLVLFSTSVSYGQSWVKRPQKSSISIVVWTSHPCQRTGEMVLGGKRYRFDKKGTTMTFEFTQSGYYSYEVSTSTYCSGSRNIGPSRAYGKGKVYVSPNKKYRLKGRR